MTDVSQADPSASNLDSLVQQLAKSTTSDATSKSVINSIARMEKQDDQMQAAKRQSFESYSRDLDKIRMPEPPVPPQMQQQPLPRTTDPLTTFGSLASTIAIFGSMRSRAPMTSAMNALGGVLGAVRKGDAEAYKNQLDIFKQQNDFALKRFDYENQVYRDILDNNKLNFEQQAAKMRTQASLFDDALTRNAAAEGKMYQWLERREDMASRMAENNARLDPATKLFNIWLENNPPPNPNASEKEKAGWQIRALAAQSGIGRASQTSARDTEEAYRQHIREQFIEQWKAAHNGQEPPPDVAQKFERQWSVAGGASEAKSAATDKTNKSLIRDVDNLIAQVQSEPSIVGGKGIIGGAISTVKGILSPKAQTDTGHTAFVSDMAQLRAKLSAYLTGSKYYSAARQAEMQKILPGTERFSSSQDALAALMGIKAQLQAAGSENAGEDSVRPARGEPGRPAGLPADAVYKGKSEGKPVWQDTHGNWYSVE